MIIDIHAHVTAPDSLYVYKSGILSHRGGHGRGAVNATDEEIIKALNVPNFGGSSHFDQLKEAGTDMQIISPRPYQMMHSESPKLVAWFTEETNNIIARQTSCFRKPFEAFAVCRRVPASAQGLPSVSRKCREGTGICRMPDQSRSR
jgi:4-oxalmesaconate hydratase